MTAPKIKVYTSAFCGYCGRAKALLSRKGAVFSEIDISMDAAKRAEMVQRTGGRMSVPQVFIGDKHIGGFEELERLEREGRLDALLKSA
ncbi:MAG TPA: glutaredoxin 3 [Sphingomonadales bacterium]|nr:glutaredoxin 3 [Sphingomonadales bacterium]